ncbi:MAG: transcriptional regulator [Pirellulales bacterium]
MNSVSSATQASVDRLPGELIEMAAVIAQLPAEYRARLEPLYHRVAENSRRRGKILNLVQEALSQLRLDMKYLLFDLEATRRERNEYRRALEGGE